MVDLGILVRGQRACIGAAKKQGKGEEGGDRVERNAWWPPFIEYLVKFEVAISQRVVASERSVTLAR